MKQLAAAFIYSNTWVAMSLSSLLFGLCTFYHLENTLLYTTFGFSSTISAYQLHRLFRLKELHLEANENSRLEWMKTHKIGQIWWFLICVTVTGIITLMIKWNSISFLLLLLNAMIVILYALPIKQFGNGFRNIPFFKNLFISSSWILFLTLPFLLENVKPPLLLIGLLGVLTFLYIIPFDIRDLPYDSQHMRTIPQLLGAEKAKMLGSLLISCCLLILVDWIGFHWILVMVMFTTFIGFYINIHAKNKLLLEFLWELPLFLMGVYFLLMV